VTPRIRPATAADAAAIAAIYNQGIQERSATFTTDAQSADAILPLIGDTTRPLLVAERDGAVVGWARAFRADDRCAQAGVGEYAIYLDRAARGQGSGRALLEALCEASRRAGYWKLVGKLFASNEASLALARRCRFRTVGTHERHGRLDGRWIDVLLVERLLEES
jgi:phosphinothricin acetyltransferase